MPARVPTSIPGIYAITRIETGRQYIGQARNIRKRWELHRHYLRKGEHHNFVLQEAWTKYGAKAFSFAILRDLSAVPTSELTVALNLAEVEVINAAKWPYNLMDGGVTTPLASVATKALLSEIAQRRWNEDAGYRERQLAGIKARYADQEWKAIRDAAVKAGVSTPEAKAKSSKKFTAMWESKEHRQTQSAKRKANWEDQDYRTQQTASRKAEWANPEIRAKRLAGMKSALTPETLAKRADAVRATYAAKGSFADVAEQSRKRWADPDYRAMMMAARAKRKAEKAKAKPTLL